MKTHIFTFTTLLLLILAPGCSKDETILHDGYYSAEDSNFDEYGWKPLITLYIYNKRIVTVEYTMQNPSGLALGWDVLRQGELKNITRMHPSHVIRLYSQELLDRQSPRAIRKIPGDVYFFDSFTTLAAAAMEQAKTGDKTVAVIDAHNPAPRNN